MMLWGWSRSWEPFRFWNHLDDLFELLGPQYPDEARTAALMVLIQVLSFDPSVPNPIIYDKCIFKKRILDSEYRIPFMKAIFSMCESSSPELRMGAFDLLSKLPLAPRKPNPKVVQRLMKEEDAPEDIVYAALLRHQDPEFARSSILFLKNRKYQKLVQPN